MPDGGRGSHPSLDLRSVRQPYRRLAISRRVDGGCLVMGIPFSELRRLARGAGGLEVGSLFDAGQIRRKEAHSKPGVRGLSVNRVANTSVPRLVVRMFLSLAYRGILA